MDPKNKEKPKIKETECNIEKLINTFNTELFSGDSMEKKHYSIDSKELEKFIDKIKKS